LYSITLAQVTLATSAFGGSELGIAILTVVAGFGIVLVVKMILLILLRMTLFSGFY
jgi:hypothetical protein